ncbi:MAG: 4Fe-4S dicluster domain-containing protein, partial [Candidatus Thorarchaeota archaeon]
DINEIKNQLQVCFSCGTCSGSCPIFRVNPEKNPRRFIRAVLDSSNSDISVLENFEPLWLCTTCYACEDRCPQGINITTMLVKLKNIAARHGYVPESVKAELETIIANGTTSPPGKSILMRRKKLSLPDLPQPDLPAIQKLIHLTLDD